MSHTSPSSPPVQPAVTISPTKDDPLSPRTLLLCTMASFYPQEIEVCWLKNGRWATKELHNGDWMYQIQVMLEDTPQRGDVYICHAVGSYTSRYAIKGGVCPLDHRITLLTQVQPAVNQHPEVPFTKLRTSKFARSKVWMGVMGALLGVVFVAVGLSLYLRSKKALISLSSKAQAKQKILQYFLLELSFSILSLGDVMLGTAASFYPREIKVQWLKNGQEVTEGVFYGEELQNGDWTYESQVMLENTTQHGDVYTSQVEHASLEVPLTHRQKYLI
ncbi:SMH class II histocompatibility antigen, beta-1 chain [Varanus komodoensis]|nr:SMH class II histocompatibility antigen, beta-1 chain [Varanus komodoensis]